MSNFLIFKAALNNSATPAIGTYTAEGATARFNRNTSISPDSYLYNTAQNSAVQWFVPTAETTDFEFVADILTRNWTNRVTYFIIADSTGTTRLKMWSVYTNWHFENSDNTTTGGHAEYIGTIDPITSGGFGVFHQFRVRVRKLTASSSSVEIYVDGTLKLTATTRAALVTCAKIGFVGGVDTPGPGTGAGVKNAYVYDLSGGDVIDRGVLSNAFTRFIGWAKGIFALKSDIPTVNDATLTIQKNGVNVQTFTANQSTAATANITVPTAVSELTNDSGYLTSSSNLDASKLTSGTVDIERLPQGALERLVKVANEAARYALTTADVQLGDTVQQLDTGIMYVVTDTDHLDSAAGYTEYTAGTAASVPWSGVTGKPTFAAVATSGAYSDLTGTPTIPTVNNGTLTIQQNGTTVDTFTANSSSDKTVNIQCVDLSTAQTVAGNKTFSGNTKFTSAATIEKSTGDVELLIKNPAVDATSVSANAVDDIRFTDSSDRITGSMRISYDTSNGVTAMMYARSYSADGSVSATNGISITSNQQTGAARASVSANLLPNSTDTYDLGSSALQWNNAYIKSLTINGVACGDILTHNASEFVPRSGGAVIDGIELCRSNNTNRLSLRGGTSSNDGASITVYANGVADSSNKGLIVMVPYDGNIGKVMYMYPSGTWTWSGTACQITSDQRLKQQISEIDDKLLDAWEDVNLVQFKYNDAVDAKKDKARLHTGYVVQQIDSACKSHGVDVSAYGLYCHEVYPEETKEVEVEQADGTKTKERKVIREASEHYSLRYTEALIVECMYLRRCIARLTARIEELEKGKEQEASK